MSYSFIIQFLQTIIFNYYNAYKSSVSSKQIFILIKYDSVIFCLFIIIIYNYFYQNLYIHIKGVLGFWGFGVLGFWMILGGVFTLGISTVIGIPIWIYGLVTGK